MRGRYPTILNQSELSYIPLEKVAPEVKMVQSLIPIWDELNVTRGTEAFRKERSVLLQGCEIARRYKEKFRNMLQKSCEVYQGSLRNSGADEPCTADVQEDSNRESKLKTNPLLLSTQAAYSKNTSLRNHQSDYESRILSMGSGEIDEKDVVLLNEELIRHQVSQSSQETDEEAVELLKWMISSRQDEVLTGYNSDCEKMDEEMSWSQVFKGADAALGKVLSDYEACSQQECQEIIDCLEATEDVTNAEINVPYLDIPQFDGSCDEDMPDMKITRMKSEGKSLLQYKEGEESRVDRTSLNSIDTCKQGGVEQRKRWGPVSVKRPSQHLTLTGDRKHVEGVSGEGVSGNSDKDLEDLSEPTLGLSEHSVRDLMRGKRNRRQQTHTIVTESSAELVPAVNFDKGSVVTNKGVLAARCHHASLVSFMCSHERQREGGDPSVRFGPLPLSRSDILAKRTESKAGMEGSPQTAQDEVDAAGCAASSKVCASVAERNVHEVPSTVGDEIGISKDRERRELESFPSATLGASPHNLNETCWRSDVTESILAQFNFTFWKKPPTGEHLLSTFQDYGLPSADHGEVFYGNLKDLPDRPAVMAGMLFKARSKGVDHLAPFQFGTNVRGGPLPNVYSSVNMWAPFIENDSAVLPSHFHNDGKAFFLLSPVKLPPTAADICKWLRTGEPQKDIFQPMGMEHEQNVDSGEGSQYPFSQIGDGTQPSQIFRPSSPKYDEAFMLPFFSKDSIETIAPQRICEPLLQTDVSLRSARQSLPNSNAKIGDASKECSSSRKDTLNGVLVEEDRRRADVSQISGPSATDSHFIPLSQAGFRDPASLGRGQQISLISVEAFACTRGDLRPDPRYDAIKCIVIILQNDINDNRLPASHSIVLLYDDKGEETVRNLDGPIGSKVILLRDETSMFNMFVWFVRMYDPDILVGWEIQGFSLGLLAERAAILGLGLLREISRLPASRNFSYALGNSPGKEIKPNLLGVDKTVESSIIDDEWGRTHGSGIHIDGRIVLNLWRIMRTEIKLGIYTLEAVAEAVLKRKVPQICWRTLTQWFTSGPGRNRHLCLEYCMNRARLNLQIMEQLDLVNRTSELARVFGIDFFSVLSRGSQYRVESMMLRIAHSQNFLLISPSRQQVAAQPAMQCLPLVMEPESRFYTDPVIVLDFQSLYPSMMIAYNLCYSTCLGKAVSDNPKVLGVTSLNLDSMTLKDLEDCLTFTPNGVMFVSAEVRPGVLPRLLEEILSTRIIVKQSMKKLLPTQKVLERVLNARQLALKLISNVTYGYTAAGFTGRMPCAELADSIVQSGRHTLESAINFVNTNTKWEARVIYGDTDSMFVLLKGRTRCEAFKIGEEIAEAITELNPHPVTLKLEKVYHPCVLLTKKRYVGYSYESVKQMTPKFDAKGIETVRRDSCAAVSKTLEKSLRILFETHDISQVKAYLQRQWERIMNGRISFQDFIFAKEVRLGSYSARASVLPPAAIVATKAMVIDPRAEPRFGERVPYIVVHGEPGARLVDMVVDPHVLVNASSALRLHDVYYISKQIIPALQRVFGLIGVDLSAWYNEVPRVYRPPSTKRSISTFLPPRYLMKHSNDGLEADIGRTKSSMSMRTIDHYYLSQHCLICGELIPTSFYVCESCSVSKELVGTSLLGRVSSLERQFKHLLAICRHCGGGKEEDMEEGHGCVSLACAVFYERIKVQKESRAAAIAANQCGFDKQHVQ